MQRNPSTGQRWKAEGARKRQSFVGLLAVRLDKCASRQWQQEADLGARTLAVPVTRTKQNKRNQWQARGWLKYGQKQVGKSIQPHCAGYMRCCGNGEVLYWEGQGSRDGAGGAAVGRPRRRHQGINASQNSTGRKAAPRGGQRSGGGGGGEFVLELGAQRGWRGPRIGVAGSLV